MDKEEHIKQAVYEMMYVIAATYTEKLPQDAIDGLKHFMCQTIGGMLHAMGEDFDNEK